VSQSPPAPGLPADVAELPRALRLLWGYEETGRRGPKPGLTLTEIAEAGVRIADAEGLDACSMSRVAKDLGVSAMALYRYVDSKSDLFLLMLDSAYGPPPSELWPPGADWRARMTVWASRNREGLLRHPWLLAVPISGPPITPNTLAWMDRGLEALADLALSQQERLSTLLLVEVYVRGQVQLARQGAVDDNGSYARRVRAVTEGRGFSHVREAVLSGALEDGDDDWTGEEFGFALETVLDGIESRIRQRPRHPKRR
jgi:AcrR family transcriptional regulator